MDILDLIGNHRAIIEAELQKFVKGFKGANEDKEILKSLVNKILHMSFNIGSPSSVKPMLLSISKGKIKYWASGWDVDYPQGTQLKGMHIAHMERVTNGALIKGHFRWNNGNAYMLSREARDYIKEYFFGKEEATATNTSFWLNKEQVKVESELLDIGVPFPNSDGKLLHNKFKITLHTKGGKESFEFYGSNMEHQKKKHHLGKDDVLQVVDCLLSDAMAGNDSFDEFCSEFAYDNDSRKAEAIYKACGVSTGKIAYLFPDADVYDLANEMREKYDL